MTRDASRYGVWVDTLEDGWGLLSDKHSRPPFDLALVSPGAWTATISFCMAISTFTSGLPTTTNEHLIGIVSFMVVLYHAVNYEML